MNRILIEKDKLVDIENSNIKIHNNEITFLTTANYTIEYIDCTRVNLNLNVEKNISVNLFIYSSNQNLEIENIYNINENSNITVYKFYNNKEVLEKIIFNLNKPYSKIDYHFSSICSNIEKYRLIINHNAPNTESNIVNKSITESQADLSFTIDSILEKGNTNCNLDQQTRIITLDDSNAKIEPNMYIEEDDVIAKHGSVIGKFSDEELFYLQTRGINESDALKLLIKGLIFSNIKVDLDKRAKIFNIINQKWR